MNQLFHINSADEVQGGQQVLSMRIGERHFSFAITDKTGAELYSLAYYSTEETTGDLLSAIFSRHEELHSSFSEVEVSYDHSRSVLLPQSSQNGSDPRVLLDVMYGNATQSSLITDPIDKWQLTNVYAVPGDVHEWVSRVFPAFRHRHNYTLGIQMIQETSGETLWIDFDKEEFSFFALKQNKLLIAQTLAYSTPEDILYSLLKTCNQFSLSREDVQLSISGLIERESQLHRELYQYFLNTSFREPGWAVHGDQRQYPIHFFTSLNDLARCAS